MRYSGYYVTNQGAMIVSSFDGDNLEDAKNQVAAVVDCHPSNVFLWPENEYEEPMEAPPPIPSQPVDDISNPEYYRSNGMEAIDMIEAFNLGYSLGNAVKYLIRAGKKGPAVDDLRKARWYIDREISRLS